MNIEKRAALLMYNIINQICHEDLWREDDVYDELLEELQNAFADGSRGDS